MALEKFIPADENPTSVEDSTIYVRTSDIRIEFGDNVMSYNFGSYESKAAYDASKQPEEYLPILGFSKEKVPATETTPVRPTTKQLFQAFPDEFDFLIALAYELAKRYDPNLVTANDAAPLTDPAVAAYINTQLDAIDAANNS